ncbi:hypothetical protein D3C84_1134200 [compost metagenome]
MMDFRVERGIGHGGTVWPECRICNVSLLWIDIAFVYDDHCHVHTIIILTEKIYADD